MKDPVIFADDSEAALWRSVFVATRRYKDRFGYYPSSSDCADSADLSVVEYRKRKRVTP